ncbi:hypothetical protein L195_g062008, partial [Trifolium pratense]
AAPGRRSVAHGAIEHKLEAQVLCRLRHGATGLRMAHLRIQLLENFNGFCAMAQRSCAWRN